MLNICFYKNGDVQPQIQRNKTAAHAIGAVEGVDLGFQFVVAIFKVQICIEDKQEGHGQQLNGNRKIGDGAPHLESSFEADIYRLGREVGSLVVGNNENIHSYENGDNGN